MKAVLRPIIKEINVVLIRRKKKKEENTTELGLPVSWIPCSSGAARSKNGRCNN